MMIVSPKPLKEIALDYIVWCHFLSNKVMSIDEYQFESLQLSKVLPLTLYYEIQLIVLGDRLRIVRIKKKQSLLFWVPEPPLWAEVRERSEPALS